MMTACCTYCGRICEVHLEGYFYDHETSPSLNICPGSGTCPLDDDLAYDGSNRPQSRTLTARERDILTRILNDVLGQIRRTGSLDGLMFADGSGGVRMESLEVQLLADVRNILDPRGEDDD